MNVYGLSLPQLPQPRDPLEGSHQGLMPSLLGKKLQIMEGQLHTQSTLGVLLKCVPASKGKALLYGIHTDIYGHHASSRALVSMVFWHGFD